MKKLKWHPASEIRGKLSSVLSGKSIALGITSSVSLYRSVDLARELIRLGADVYVVMSPEATKYVTPRLFEWATGNDVFVDFAGEVGHITLAEICDAFVIAPATANTIAKIALGVSDTSVTVLAQSFLGLKKPVVMVPAAHYSLLTSPPISEAIGKLEKLGVTIVPPVIEERRAKYPPLEEVVAAVETTVLRSKDLKGLKFLVTAGPTREPLDNVRFLTNSSSGRMGLAIAREAYFRGAEVTLVHGPLAMATPHYIRSIAVRTTQEMLDAVLSELKSEIYDAIVLAAAPVDFRFADVVRGKISSEVDSLSAVMVPTPKISSEIRKVFEGLVVGFAAEFAGGRFDDLVSKAREKLAKRGFNIVVANDISKPDIGFASEYNEVVVLTDKGESVVVSKTRKAEVARVILDQILKYLGN
ncbi:MAG: bifunctional phosphopantothenoylcysteine decarboxylase/phosphopantothenate--cysteine ligase CoaBC [Sulfolobales archaeon]